MTVSVFNVVLVIATVVVAALSQEVSPLGCCFSFEDWLLLLDCDAERRRRTGDGIVVDVTIGILC